MAIIKANEEEKIIKINKKKLIIINKKIKNKI